MSEERQDFIRDVRLLDCVREVIERQHGLAYWATIYRDADKLRREKAQRLANGDQTWES